ncbi:MAG: hypothetical protein IK093_20410 [Ruminiclostridium sp.]|nr:hypothetical protein [Ruminiclostridium sp.]
MERFESTTVSLLEDVLDPMIESIADDESVDIKAVDLSVCAEKFLKNAGMTGEQLEKLIGALGRE